MSKKLENSKGLPEHKSWKIINQERKLLKKKRKQEKLLKELEKTRKLNELSNASNLQNSENKNEKNLEIQNNKDYSTISIAVPGSILDNAQSQELRTYLAGQIARAACIFRVDEIIVFDDGSTSTQPRSTKTYIDSSDSEAQTKTISHSCLQLARILQFLECPQYLRKFFFPLHNDLKYSGLLNPLDAPHHLRQQNTFMYREGIVTEKKVKDEKGSFVNIGLLNDILVDKSLVPGLRVTVRIDNFNEQQQKNMKKMKGIIVPPNEPRLKTGIYWGYTVRIAQSLSEIFTKCPYTKNGYDLTIGTSDKGTSIHEIDNQSLKYKNALIVFGGLKGIECALENDDKLNIDNPKLLFDNYLNVVPLQGSRTIRTEEALLITLSILQDKLKSKFNNINMNLDDYKNLLPQSEDTGKKQYRKINAKNQINDDDLSRFD